jgi:hypothetical protein
MPATASLDGTAAARHASHSPASPAPHPMHQTGKSHGRIARHTRIDHARGATGKSV